MNTGYEQIPQSFIEELEAKRRRLVQAQEENGVNLDALVDFLYPDTAHLVFELLQNAEDAGATFALFELSKTKLSFTHDGRPFSREDLDSITNYFKSAKYEKEDTIGRFGIGFKSVFGCTETPRIYSDTVAFEIVDRIVPRAIPRPASSMRLSKRETVIELPFSGAMKTVDELRGEIRRGLARMSVMSVLHLERIKLIEWRTDDGDSGWIKRTELDDGVVQVDATRPPGAEKRFFLRFREQYAEASSMHLDIVFHLEERKREQGTLDELGESLADRFRIVPAERGGVAVFFPAAKETSKLRFHLHAPFIPELSRASIKEHPENNDLIGRLAELAAKSLSTIRDLGLLDREFLGVLPHSQDRLPESYGPFHAAVVRAMREEPLVPMQGGGHGRAARLLQGRPADLKGLLGVDDLRFLMSGWDRDPRYHHSWSPKIDRSAKSSSNSQGWAVSATQRNTDVDRFLNDLTIREFKIEHLVPPTSKTDEEVEEWLTTHDVPWHRDYYASLDRVGEASPGAYKRLQRLPIVRTRSGEYRPAAECRFASDEEVPDGVTIADPDIYFSGKGAKRAKAGLERLGVQEIDDESRAVGILVAYYGGSGNRPAWDRHRNHIESFIELVGSGKVTADKFVQYSLLLDCEKDWKRPDDLYAGNGYQGSIGAPYFRHLERLDHRYEVPADELRYELYSQYRRIPGFDDFAQGLGVAYQIPILETTCRSNPQYRHLRSGGGEYWTGYGIDRDSHIPCLDRILQLLESAKSLEAERIDLARAIWAALPETTEEPLQASFRLNGSADLRTAPSQLVVTLHRYAWVPQQQGREGLVFVTPREARRDRLPEGFAFDPGWAWIKATGFGEERREVRRTIVPERLDQEAKAKDLGFESLEAAEEARRFTSLSEEERSAIWERLRRRSAPQPDFDRPRNPERRRKRAKKWAEEAPNRKTIRSERSIVEGEARLKEDARTKLRANYEQRAHVSLCQVIGCEDRSFKLKEETWYFEAVRFLGLDRMVADDYVALCPRHAAMYQHAKESDGLKQEFAQRCAVGNRGKGIAIPVVLAGENVDVLLAPKHVIDLEAALEVDGERDSEGD